MWQSPTPVHNFYKRELTGLEAWAHLFSEAWEKLEVDPEDLSMYGLDSFGRAVAEKHGDEDPAAVAARLYPECGEFYDDVYPPVIVIDRWARADPPAAPLGDADMPF